MLRAAAFATLSGFAALAGAGPASSAECVIYRHSVAFGAEQEVQMMVSSGKDCRVQFPLRTQTVIDVNEITAHPHYGGVRVHGTSGAYYRSNPGYRGPDQFAFAFCGQDTGKNAGKTACARVRVRVEVR